MRNLHFNLHIEEYVALILNMERKSYFIQFPEGNVDSPFRTDVVEPLTIACILFAVTNASSKYVEMLLYVTHRRCNTRWFH